MAAGERTLIRKISHLPGTIVRIVLVGFMGAGKSTVGPLLAARLSWTFVDADQCLERESGSTVAEIFEKHGEAWFRRLEADTIQLLMAGENRVLALGGGALELEATRSLLKETDGTCVVFLKAPAETLLARCMEQSRVETAADGAAPPVRPLLEELRQDPTRLQQKLAARLPYYLSAHLTVLTAELTPDEVADRILAELARLSTLPAQSPTPPLEVEHAP